MGGWPIAAIWYVFQDWRSAMLTPVVGYVGLVCIDLVLVFAVQYLHCGGLSMVTWKDKT